MKKTEIELLYCKNCNKATEHTRTYNVVNTKLHIFLMLITGFMYAVVYLFIIAKNSGAQKPLWKCTQCGMKS